MHMCKGLGVRGRFEGVRAREDFLICKQWRRCNEQAHQTDNRCDQARRARVSRWDDELRGFGLRVKHRASKPGGPVQYRTDTGRTRRLAIGQVGRLTPESARKEARELLGKVDKGQDPSAERKAARMSPTEGRLMDRYLSEHVKRHNRASTKAEVNRLIEKHIKPAMGSLKTSGITRQDVLKFQGNSGADAAPSEPCAGNTEQGLQSRGGLGASARRCESLSTCEEISRDKAGAISSADELARGLVPNCEGSRPLLCSLGLLLV